MSLSLLETTEICERLTGNHLEITPVTEDRAGDVPVFLTDCSALFQFTEWRPQRDPETVMRDIHEWASSHRDLLAGAL